MKEKFVPQRDDVLIFNRRDYGPTFGGGSDIAIHDGCNNHNSSHANFPCTYNRKGGNKLERNQNSFHTFSGGYTYHFRVEEYEVFKLWYSE